jgi:peptide/nickel transport system substrate-binding protein
MLALQVGEIDAFAEHGLPPSLIEEMEANPDITVEVMMGSGIVDLGFNVYSDGYRDEEYGGPHLEPEVNPLQDKVLRQAIAYAIDMEAIIDLVYQGYGTLTDSYLYVESPNHNPDLEMYEFDPTTARSMLESEGYYWAA